MVCLTISAAKGQEFDIVFLVNFFTHSQYDRWTVLDDYTRGDACLAWRQEQAAACAVAFDPEPVRNPRLHPYLRLDTPGKDRALCSELKHLYVGVTRSRTHVFLLEEVRTVRTEAPLSALSSFWPEHASARRWGAPGHWGGSTHSGVVPYCLAPD